MSNRKLICSIWIAMEVSRALAMVDVVLLKNVFADFCELKSV